MAKLQVLIQSVTLKYPHLKRVDDVFALVAPDLVVTDELKEVVLENANSIDAGNAATIDAAMDTNVGFIASLTGNQAIRDLARLIVLAEAVVISMSKVGKYSELQAKQRSIVSANNLGNARKAAAQSLAAVQRLEAKRQADLRAEAARREAEIAKREAEALQAEMARREEADRRARLKTLAEAAVTERDRRITVKERVSANYAEGIRDLARMRQTKRTDWENFATRYVANALDRYTSAVVVMDQAVEDVDRILGTAAAGAERRAKFKREIATCLFKAVRKYAPPPFNLAGALVEAGVNLAMNVLDQLNKQTIAADLTLTVDGASLGKAALDFMQKTAVDSIQAGRVPSLTSIDGDATVAGMLDKAKRQAIDMVTDAIAEVLKTENLALGGRSLTADYEHQQSLVRGQMSLSHLAGAGEAPPPSEWHRAVVVPAPLPVGRKGFEDQFNKRLADAKNTQYVRFLSLTDQLERSARLGSPPPSGSSEFRRLTLIFLYALAIKGRVEANKKAGSNDIPKLEPEEQRFLSRPEIGLISNKKTDAATGTFPMYYNAGSNTSCYVLVATLLDFAACSHNPFAAVFSGRTDAISGMERELQGFYVINKAYGESVRDKAEVSSNRKLLQTVSGYKSTAYAAKLYD